MILEQNDAQERLDSPNNLMNRLKELTQTKSGQSDIPSLPPSADKLIDNLEDKLKIGGLKSKAADILSTVLDELKNRLPEVKPDRMHLVADSMNRILTAETAKRDISGDGKPSIIIYAPQQHIESHYETITVTE